VIEGDLMRSKLAALAGAGVLAFPVANAVAGTGAAVAAPKRTIAPVKHVTTKTFAGIAAQAIQSGNVWGTVEITVTLRTTTITIGTRRSVRRKYTNLGGRYSYHTARSQFIMSQALPLLRQEFLQAQSADVQMISGATYTSHAFLESLQSALLRARSARTS
jgi:uncharacterized protein with FMN-binding domain